MSKNKRIVLTGGTYAGKTTLLKEFANLGYRVIPETGLIIIERLNKKMGIRGQKEWRAANPIDFYSLIIEEQINLETQIGNNKNTIFLDRGLHDYIAFLKLAGVNISNEIIEHGRIHLYDLVFNLQTLPSFNERPESGRSLNKQQSLELQKLISQTYSEYGMRVVNIKETNIAERLTMIKKNIE